MVLATRQENAAGSSGGPREFDPVLTKRQKQILDYLREFIAQNGYAPSFHEVCEEFGYTSLATVHEHLANLERKGYIAKRYRGRRAVQLMPHDDEPAITLPVLGTVAAGEPIEAVETQDSLPVPPSMIRGQRDHYVLRVAGESMIDEQIRDGDYIVVHSRREARDGEMVVALVGGDAATVKKLYRAPEGRVRLQPANPDMAPIFEPAANVQVQGVVVGLIRTY